MSKNNYKVYVHINKINGKRYFGITKQEVEKRWGKNGYRYRFYIDKEGRKHGNKHFWSSICKYGWDNFEHIVIARGLTKEEAKWLEIELIREWDTRNQDKGYNITKGGDGVNGFKHTKEARKKMSEVSKTRKGKNSPRATKIYCVELEQYFDTIQEGAKFVGCCDSNISYVLTRNGKTAGGYHWVYAEDVNEENINKVMSEEYNKYINNSKPKQVYCVELDMYFDTITEAGEFIGCNRGNISAVLTGRYKTAGGYHWVYAEDVNEENINKVMSEEYNINGHGKKIYCIELDMYFESVTKASEFIGCCDSTISSVLRGTSKTAKGYHWLYAEDVDIENNKVS